jgi:2-keto-4-pentenoate hydratase/2-oxohepta-3-ene-1,7-dioic acid hydratase in catechol pathway
VSVPPGCRALDFELEVAAIVGREGSDLTPEDARRCIAGYTILNDWSARDLQSREMRVGLGPAKGKVFATSLGPWIVTADELDGRDTRVRGWVNGELRQDARTRDMIFDIPTLIETCSRGITLYPGDVIATGTPSGVGMGFSPPRWLVAGDVVRIEIDGIGAIENTFK